MDEIVGGVKEKIDLGPWDEAGLRRMLRVAAAISPTGERIGYISGWFLGIPYKEATLVGSPEVAEELVISLGAVDCFTYIDYVEAMRLSGSFGEFKEELRMVRYRKGVVTYGTRYHFFTDWKEDPRVRDVTRDVGRARVHRRAKVLNKKDDGSLFLAGIREKPRDVTFIPSGALDETVTDRLQTGDYVGIYAETEGLDVTHVGIINRLEEGIFFRHASLTEKKVVDQDIRSYFKGKPGIVVLRAAEEIFL